MIFQGETATSELDKTSATPAEIRHWIIRFGTTPHGGGYDPILAPTHAAGSRRSVWSGSTYLPAEGNGGPD